MERRKDGKELRNICEHCSLNRGKWYLVVYHQDEERGTNMIGLKSKWSLRIVKDPTL